MRINMIILAGISVLLQACAGSRASYESLIETKNDTAAIYLSVGETKEVLAISNGFPGWWGIYPGVASVSPEIASVSCRDKRSAIPFRAPGLVLGGEVCYLTANSLGETWLIHGNKFNLDITSPDLPENKIKLVVTKPE
ncbi:hypothetical protein AB4876_14985 [Zhongshania guokunii]|uniref:Lipoprotein n=1 Tax=Zhongshania guokunii TaxID=641783 RepID=A0ABV3U8E5_9GAMM